MWSGLGHHIVWYIVLNVFEEHYWPLFMGHPMNEAVCPDRNLGTKQLRLRGL
jgi:hypothetical protein